MTSNSRGASSSASDSNSQRPSSSSGESSSPSSSAVSSNSSTGASSSSGPSSSTTSSDAGGAGRSDSQSSGQSSSRGSSSSKEAGSSSSSSKPSLSTSVRTFVTDVNGHPSTWYQTSTSTIHPKAGNLSGGGNDDGYWNDSGAVGGTFAAVGIVAVALLAALGYLLYRRRRAKRMDADVMAAASAAAATTRTPFDDDDEDMTEVGPYARHPNDGASYHSTNSNLHPYYDTAYDTSAFRQPSHFAGAGGNMYTSLPDHPYNNIVDQPTSPPMGQGVTYYAPTDPPRVQTRGMYESVPTDSAQAYNHTLYDSVPGGPPAQAVSGGAPSMGETNSAQANMMSSRASESTTTDFEPAQSHLSHSQPFETAAPVAVGAIPQASNPSQPYTALSAPLVRESLPSQNHTSYMGTAYTTPEAVSQGGSLKQQPPEPPYETAPPYDPSTAIPVSDAKVSPAEAATEPQVQPRSTAQPSATSPDISHAAQLDQSRLGVSHAFGDEGQSAMDHGDWDPPALSSAWFPHTEPSATESPAATDPPFSMEKPNVASDFRMSDQRPYPDVFNMDGHSTEPESGATDAAPRLRVRNPSPEETL